MLYQPFLDDQPDELRFCAKLVMGPVSNPCRHRRVRVEIEVNRCLNLHRVSHRIAHDSRSVVALFKCSFATRYHNYPWRTILQRPLLGDLRVVGAQEAGSREKLAAGEADEIRIHAQQRSELDTSSCSNRLECGGVGSKDSDALTATRLFRAPLNRFLPFPFQLLLEDLCGDPLVNLGKIVEGQRGDDGQDIRIDNLEGKHPARLQFTDEARIGNGSGHASIC